MYNEILTPVIEKQKILEANERSVYQLLELFDKVNNDKPKSYRCTKELKFLITRCFWRITKIYSHYTFEQARFKREFVLINKKSAQNAKNTIEKDFFKLMNNTNFGHDCRNNANNAKFEPIIDEVNEIT